MADEPTVDGVPMADAMRDAIKAQIDPHRTPEFAERLQERLTEDAPLLARLSDQERIDRLIESYNAKVADFAAETRRNSELLGMIDAARAVHPPRESRYGQVICDGCGLLWPCPTIRALKED